jgi:orotidine-5'-phosphate decarboxylase
VRRRLSPGEHPVTTHLSQKAIPRHERLIVALDYSTKVEALALVDDLGDSVDFYKLGLQMFMGDDYWGTITELKKRGKKVFADLKFFDVPQTVAGGVKGLATRHVDFATIHGNAEVVKFARKAAQEVGSSMKLLAVTVLTSLDAKDIQALGFTCDVEELVLHRARQAIDIGFDGVIASGREAEKIRSDVGDQFLIVIPGIRDPGTLVDDQKRTVDVDTAFQNGADYIVVGRPISKASSPRQAAEDIQGKIAELFPS